MKDVAQTEPVRLALVDVVAVRSPLDRFRCEPYRAVLTAQSCVDRQGVAAVQMKQLSSRTRGSSAREANAKRADYFLCRECPVGAEIRRGLSN